jgi:hypothetical protein
MSSAISISSASQAIFRGLIMACRALLMDEPVLSGLAGTLDVLAASLLHCSMKYRVGHGHVMG